MASARPKLRDRFRITRIGAYFYHRRYTLSLTWCLRWRWLPWIKRFGCGSWMLGWLKFGIERHCWDFKDDWGEQAAEIWGGVLEQLVTGEGPLMELEATECDD